MILKKSIEIGFVLIDFVVKSKIPATNLNKKFNLNPIQIWLKLIIISMSIYSYHYVLLIVPINGMLDLN